MANTKRKFLRRAPTKILAKKDGLIKRFGYNTKTIHSLKYVLGADFRSSERQKVETNIYACSDHKSGQAFDKKLQEAPPSLAPLAF